MIRALIFIVLACGVVAGQNTNSSTPTERQRTASPTNRTKPPATEIPKAPPTQKPPATTPPGAEGVLAAFNALLDGIRHASVNEVMGVYWNSTQLNLFNYNGTVTKGWQQVRKNRESSYPEIKDVKLGQPVAVDTRNGIIQGQVQRIDPAAREGTFTVDVTLVGPLPASARPDLSVDGTIELERLLDVLYVGRPAFGQGQQTVGLFRLTPDGQEAIRVQVTLGRSSVSTIEVVNGLKEGDQIILSDTSSVDSFDRIRVR